MVSQLEEGSEALEEEGDENVLDLGIIGAGSRVEHCEMAGYMTAISLAEQLGQSEVVKLLNENLKEEQEAEKKLRGIAQRIINAAPAEGEGDGAKRKKLTA